MSLKWLIAVKNSQQNLMSNTDIRLKYLKVIFIALRMTASKIVPAVYSYKVYTFIHVYNILYIYIFENTLII